MPDVRSITAAQLRLARMTHGAQPFFNTLGTRIAALPKTASPNPQVIADVLEIARQTYANYEVTRARPAVAMLPVLAELFGVSVDELLGLHRGGSGRRGPTPLPQKQIERSTRLPKAQQKVVMQMLDGILSQSGR